MNGKIYALHPIGEPNQIRYIGKCSNGKLRSRLSDHKCEAKKDKGNLWKNNWIKSLNYEIEITELYYGCQNLEELNKKEIEMIADYKSKGYELTNLTKGGDGNTYSTLDKNHSARKVIQYDLEGNFIQIFNSMKEAELKIGIKSDLISGCVCAKRIKSAGGYIWKYFEENYPTKIEPYKRNHGGGAAPKKVESTNITTGEIVVYSSITEAASKLGIYKQNIRHNLKGNTKTTFGCIWKYV